MNNLNDLFISELKNLYALEKQTSEVLENLHDSASHKKLDKRLRKIYKCTSKNFDKVHANLQQLDINPGNVVDSIVREISYNFQDIIQEDLDATLKDVSLWTSLNRLLSYKVACYENANELASRLGKKDIAKDLSKCLVKTDKELNKLHGKTKKKILERVS